MKPGPKSKDPKERFLSKIEKQPSGCWRWIGTTNKCGYGQFYLEPQMRLAHRVAFEFFVRPIPEGMDCCHKCDNPPCVNPEHLFIGTAKDNMLDASRKGRIVSKLCDSNKLKTHCASGHEYSGDNLLFYKKERVCKTCKRNQFSKWLSENREAHNARRRARRAKAATQPK